MGHRVTVTAVTSEGNLDGYTAQGQAWCAALLELCAGQDAEDGRRLQVGDHVSLSAAAHRFPRLVAEGCLRSGRVGVLVQDDADAQVQLFGTWLFFFFF
jgi:hypothetical protein